MPEQQAFGEVLKAILAGRHLTRQQAHDLFGQLMDGQLDDARMAGLLVALAAKGECVEEIVGAAQAMRARAVKIDTRGAEVIDVVGTGGTHVSTFHSDRLAIAYKPAADGRPEGPFPAIEIARLEAEGNVLLVDGTIRIKARTIDYRADEDLLEARGNPVILTEQDPTRGVAPRYEKETLRIRDVSSRNPSVYGEGRGAGQISSFRSLRIR